MVMNEQLLALVDAAVKTSVETSKPEVTYQCRRITEGLRLAEGIGRLFSLNSAFKLFTLFFYYSLFSM